MPRIPKEPDQTRAAGDLKPPAAGAALLGLMITLTLAAGQTPPDADEWLAGGAVYPAGALPGQIETNRFDSLHAEVIADKLKVSWKSPEEPGGIVRLLASQDKPGHWPARDWREIGVTRAGGVWEASPPVDDLDIPVVYFVWSASGARTNTSPMRVCLPREAGLDMPSRPFWPFVEGFESGIEGWTLLGAAADDPPLGVSTTSKSGHAALLARPPAGRKKSTAIGTTRLRGSRIVAEGATGVTLWMRTVSGKGRARFTLYANAFTTNQVAATAGIEAALGPQWGKVTLPFESFPRIPLASVDYFALELVAEDADGFLLDDVQWLGPWKGD